MGTSGGNLVSNALDALRSLDPEVLSRLKARYPEYVGYLDESLGQFSAIRRVELEVAAGALDSVLYAWHRKAGWLRNRQARANKWELAGAVVACLGSGSIVPLYLTDSSASTIPIAAVIAFSGGLIGIAKKHLGGDLFGGEGSLQARHQALIEAAVQASALSRRLKPFIEANDDDGRGEELRTLLEEADDLICRMVRDLEMLPGM